MCVCKNKCNCNITSTTKGEKGDASPSASLGYKVYTAILTQTGTSAPSANVLQNTLGGTPVFSYISTGEYRITLTGLLTANKRVVMFGVSREVDGANGETRESDLVIEDDDKFQFFTLSSAASNSNEWVKRIEIRIYN